MPRLNYQKVNWEDAPSTATPLNAENLDNMDNGLAALYQDVADLEEAVENIEVTTDITNLPVSFGEPGEPGVDDAPLQPSGSVLGNIITGIHSRIRALISSVANINTSIEELNTDISDLNTGISDLNTALSTEISNVDDKVDGVLSHSKVLWSGVDLMGADATVNLSENIIDQFSGILLVWSGYSGGAAQNYQWHYDYVSKEVVSLNPGHGITCILAGAAFNPIGTKYVYMNNDNITGFASNTQSGTRNGITYSNGSFALRYVIGI